MSCVIVLLLLLHHILFCRFNQLRFSSEIRNVIACQQGFFIVLERFFSIVVNFCVQRVALCETEATLY